MAARKTTSKSKPAEVVEKTPVRNTTVPPRTSSSSSATATATSRRPNPTTEQIAKKAYEIWQSGKGGNQAENWFRAERELRGY